jgi:hypothetical protein
VKVETLDGRSYPDMYGTGHLDNGNVTYGKVSKQVCTYFGISNHCFSSADALLYSETVNYSTLLHPSVTLFAQFSFVAIYILYIMNSLHICKHRNNVRLDVNKCLLVL